MKHCKNYLLSSSSLVAVSLAGMTAFAAPQDAGSVIGNQAVATYTNAAGDSITVTSNKVETIVQQVAGVSMTSDNSEEIAPGGKAFLPHIVTNDGNGPDSFGLSFVDGAGDFNFDAVVFYADANLDGVADNATPITETPVLAAGERFGFVIDASAPSSATAGQSETLAITAASILTGAVTALNTDTLTVATGAIMELVKSMVVDKASGPGDPTIVDAGDTVTVTLTYSNTGLASSTNYAVEDVLDARLPYETTTAQWSDSVVVGGLDETNGTGIDATNGSGETIAFDVTGNTIDFVISNVASGRTGSVTFETTIGSTADAGLIENTATQSDSTGNYPQSNTASVTVDSQFSHVIADTFTQRDTTVVASTTDDGASGDDTITENTDAPQGGTIAFEFVVGNSSNNTDSYTLDVANNAVSGFPAGTTFRFVGSDGATPIVGSVGPLAAGEATKVIMLATLPADAPADVAGSTNYTATVTAISDNSGNTDPSTAEFVGAVLAATVDLQNTTATAADQGVGAFPTDGGLAYITTDSDPGVPVSFPMNITNQGTTSDSYNLSLAQALPLGWTVEYQLDDGSIVTNTGTIPAGQSVNVNVIVTPAEGALPGTTPIDISIVSPVSGQGDSILNEVNIVEVIDVSIVEGQTVQAAAGGVVDILHTVTNEGNVNITEGTILHSGLSDFSGAIYWDANDNGVLDSTDPVVDNFDDLANNIGGTTAGLEAGDTISLIYRVQVGAVPGYSETATITLDDNLNGDTKLDRDTSDNANQDQITVISGDVTLIKTQAIDASCNGAGLTAFTKDRQDVDPGQCIRYRIQASNTGTTAVADVIIKDIVPAYTNFDTCGGLCPATATEGPVTGASTVSTASAPNISSDHGTIPPGGTGTLEFTVKVDE